MAKKSSGATAELVADEVAELFTERVAGDFEGMLENTERELAERILRVAEDLDMNNSDRLLRLESRVVQMGEQLDRIEGALGAIGIISIFLSQRKGD